MNSSFGFLRAFFTAFLLSPGLAQSHAQGVPAWVARYSGPSNVIDQALAVAVDAAGNTFLTGSGDRNGPLLGGDMVTVKFDPQGRSAWSARHGNPGGMADSGTAITLDAAGNIYAAGYSQSNPTNATFQDYVTVKYSPEGIAMWSARFSAPSNPQSKTFSMDYPRAIAVDTSGSVYVTGVTMDSAGDARDYATVKHDRDGRQLWFAIYDSPDHRSDSAQALAVNMKGEVYVAGHSGLVKYDANGTLLWHRPALANALALDSNGNAIVAGSSMAGNFDESDYEIIKYSPDGDPLWTATYDGAIGQSDGATCLRIGPGDDVYVTGTSDSRCYWVLGFEVQCDPVFVTLKLDSEGRLAWASTEHPSPNPGGFPIGLELDANGGLYVLASEGGSSGTLVLKYGPDGTRLWRTRYRDEAHGRDTPAGFGSSATGDIYAGGSSFWRDGGSDDYFALKLVQLSGPALPVIVSQPRSVIAALRSNATFAVSATATGPLRWQWRFNGAILPGETNSTLFLKDVQFDQAGDYSVDVLGEGGLVGSADARLGVRLPIQFSGSPERKTTVEGSLVEFKMPAHGSGPIAYQWLFNGSPIEGATNEVLTLSSLSAADSGDYTLRAFDEISSAVSPVQSLVVSTRAQLCWETRSREEIDPRFDKGRFIALDPEGNVRTVASGVGVTRRDGAGNEVWTAPFLGVPLSVACDTNGNVYVTGYGRGASNTDFLTTKYSPDGQAQWSRVYNGEIFGDDYVTALALDREGNVIVTGVANIKIGLLWTPEWDGSRRDIVTIKYSPDGEILWLSVYDRPGQGQDTPAALAVDSAGNVYVIGSTYWRGSNNNVCTILKYSPEGSRLWAADINSPYGYAFASSIAADPNGNVVVAGQITGPIENGLPSLKPLVAKYDSSGQELWRATYDGRGNRRDNPDGFEAVAIDREGSVIAAGTTYRRSSKSNGLAMKFGADGRHLWTARSPGSANTGFAGLALDAQGNAFVSAFSADADAPTFSTLKYDPDGNLVWQSQYQGGGPAAPGSIAVDASGNVFATGAVTLMNSRRLVTLRYCQAEVAEAPVITRPPLGGGALPGTTPLLSVAAQGKAPLNFQWWHDGVPIFETNVTLALPNFQQRDAGEYYVEVCNELGCAMSPVAAMSVLSPLWLDPPILEFGAMRITARSLLNLRFAIEASDDLQTWEEIGVSGPEEAIVTTTVLLTGKARFFRAVLR